MVTDPEEYNDLFGVLVPLEQYKIQLREQASGVAS
jgi:DNA primase